MRVALLAFSFLMLAGSPPAAEPEESDLGAALVEVPNVGEAVVVYPGEWEANTVQPSKDLPPTVRLRSGSDGKPVSLQITLIPDPTRKLSDEKELARAVLGAGEHFKAGSVEGKTQLVRLPSRTGKGLFASFTDARWQGQPPPAGEYRHATVGAVSLGDTVASFTLLSKDLEGPNYQLALIVLADGLQRTPPAAPER
jgi:hypothetical protein